MAALITFWSSEPAGLKEVPGPTWITAPEQFTEKKQTDKNKEIKRILVFILITKLSNIYTFLYFLYSPFIIKTLEKEEEKESKPAEIRTQDI
ncbi:hypothetical protein [Methanosarcina sp.]|jgi:hypothetical protein|uniref:hypothetical protein n=1 Tax=Methanosarcina sp. TaxID=2213 RepID=UPI002C0F2B4B|nr:hypothetical protein [Methanosarcina sp.]HOW14421.1 hypothetical protein [Methanosarcina sp.]